MFGLYILDGKMAVRCDSPIDWSFWYGTHDHHVADDTIFDIRISTIFLGLDHNFGRTGDPLLFESMIFFPNGEREQVRYFTYAEAEAGHKELVEMIKEQVDATKQITKDVLRGIMAKRVKS